MLLNIVLIFLLFASSKKKLNPYLSASIFGAIKSALYFLTSGLIQYALIYGVVYGGLAFGMVYFLGRIDRKEPPGPSYGTPGAKNPGERFIWEWIPLSLITVILIFGEFAASLIHLHADE